MQAWSDALQLLAIIGPVLPEELLPQLLRLLPGIVGCLSSALPVLRSLAMRCAVENAKAHTDGLLPSLFR